MSSDGRAVRVGRRAEDDAKKTVRHRETRNSKERERKRERCNTQQKHRNYGHENR